MSFVTDVNYSLEDSVRNLIASGVTCVVAAGNNGVDAGRLSVYDDCTKAGLRGSSHVIALSEYPAPKARNMKARGKAPNNVRRVAPGKSALIREVLKERNN